MSTRQRTVGILVIALLLIVGTLPVYAVRPTVVAEVPMLAQDLANQLTSVQTGRVNKPLPALAQDEPATYIVELVDAPLATYNQWWCRWPCWYQCCRDR